MAALAVSTATLIVLGWLTFVAVPAVQLTLERGTSGEWIVADVPVAEFAWLAGVRPGMTVQAFVPPGSEPAQDWESLLATDGALLIGVQRHEIPPHPAPFTVSAIALVFAVVAHRLTPTAASWLLVAPALTSLAAASDLVPAALSFGLVIAPAVVGALYAAEPIRRLHRFTPAVAALAVLLAAAGWLLAYALRFESWVLPRQLSAGIAVGLLVAGSAGVVRQALWRARTRLERHGSAPASLAVLLAATVDELIPGRARSRLLAIEHERAGLASDLHAEVLPDLAAVIRSVDAGIDPAEAAVRLRAIADELRDLMAERRLSVLDELGLVPALEWLAERIEERTNVRVEIDIKGADVARAPREVELAAYRIAQQAIDNALVHARPSRIRITVEITGNRLELVITDDGAGIGPDDEARALRAGHLGLADMRQRAAVVGGAFRVWQRAEGGTTAALRWPG